jgi:hypothetical protein
MGCGHGEGRNLHGGRGARKTAGLTVHAAARNLKYMRRIVFAALVLGALARGAHAQQVPGRDLLDFPLGTLGEAPALATQLGDGLWNPATVSVPLDMRLRIAAAAFATAAEQGATAQTLAAAMRVSRELTVGLVALRAGVRDIVRTDTDPQSVAGDVPYGTNMLSALVARRDPYFTTGVALRFRTGQLDGIRRSAFGLDAGIVTKGLGARDARLALASYLWSPGAGTDERPGLTGAADLRLGGASPEHEMRLAYAVTATQSLGPEHYLVASGRNGHFSARAGISRATSWGLVTWGSRVGLGLHSARYSVGLSREERDGGLPASYQFLLTSRFP